VCGPTVIGHDATIGKVAVVVASVVLPGATVPDGSLVASAVHGHLDHVLPAIFRHRAADQQQPLPSQRSAREVRAS
jgi:hypothetical protein